MDIVNRNQVKAFITKDTSEIREILAPRNSSIQRQSLAEATLQPGRETEEHFHATSEEIYYVLQGAGRMRIEGEVSEVGPGDGIAILPGRKHKLWNTGEGDLVFLCLCVPPYEHEDTMITEGSA
jgi:mannose-6-phosphate isomerase-like protein (cupin superfamily)